MSKYPSPVKAGHEHERKPKNTDQKITHSKIEQHNIQRGEQFFMFDKNYDHQEVQKERKQSYNPDSPCNYIVPQI